MIFIAVYGQNIYSRTSASYFMHFEQFSSFIEPIFHTISIQKSPPKLADNSHFQYTGLKFSKNKWSFKTFHNIEYVFPPKIFFFWSSVCSAFSYSCCWQCMWCLIDANLHTFICDDAKCKITMRMKIDIVILYGWF